jgi:hypothetical protein
MFRKSAKPASNGQAAPAPKKRSKLVLGLLAAVPLLLAGGGYAGWTFLLAAPGEAHAAEGGAEGTDPMKVAALPPEIVAETSFTHSFALSVLIRDKCGDMRAPALKAASEDEARADGMLVNLSWQSAARRAAALEARSCGHISAELANAEFKAEAKAAAKRKAEGKPAHH